LNEVAPTKRKPGRAQGLLALGALAGIALAVASLLSRPDRGALPGGSVARVNGVLIREQDYERAVAALASDRRNPLAEADRRHVLDRLIDEELLVQYGISLGLARSDRRVRADLVGAILAAQVASVDGFDPSASELKAFYRENRGFFSPPGRIWVRSLWFAAEPRRTAEQAVERARSAVVKLRSGESFTAVAEALGDRQVAPIPDAPLPPAKLREYIGPSALAAAASLAVGAVSDPLVSAAGVRVLLLVSREVGEAPALETLENEVKSEMKRRAGDAAVRRLLDELRADGELRTVERIP